MEITVYSKLVGMVVYGKNIKRDGSLREWHGAALTGKFRIGAQGDKQVEAKETTKSGKFTKWISLRNFTGSIGNIVLVNGERQQKEEQEVLW